ncbi:MAG: archease [Candidatus Hadarchaeales archaeon]
MKRFDWIEHPSDVGFRAYGRTLSEAFENAAIALFEIMVDTSTVRPEIEKSIVLRSEDPESLLYDWLDRLIALHDSEQLVFSKFEVNIAQISEGFLLNAKAWGEKFDPSRHEGRTAVKAMTYHMMEIKKKNDEWLVQAVVDI